MHHDLTLLIPGHAPWSDTAYTWTCTMIWHCLYRDIHHNLALLFYQSPFYLGSHCSFVRTFTRVSTLLQTTTASIVVQVNALTKASSPETFWDHQQTSLVTKASVVQTILSWQIPDTWMHRQWFQYTRREWGYNYITVANKMSFKNHYATTATP